MVTTAFFLGQKRHSVSESSALLHLVILPFVYTSLDLKHLKLIEVIGQGSFGGVHMASWRKSLVAAKVITVSTSGLKHSKVQQEIGILK